MLPAGLFLKQFKITKANSLSVHCSRIKACGIRYSHLQAHPILATRSWRPACPIYRFYFHKCNSDNVRIAPHPPKVNSSDLNAQDYEDSPKSLTSYASLGHMKGSSRRRLLALHASTQRSRAHNQVARQTSCYISSGLLALSSVGRVGRVGQTRGWWTIRNLALATRQYNGVPHVRLGTCPKSYGVQAYLCSRGTVSLKLFQMASLERILAMLPVWKQPVL